MDPSTQYEHQQQPVAVESQPYDPSQYQPYDPYSAYHGQYQQYTQEQYAAYYAQYYANPYQSQHESASIHPPGVPVTPQTTYLPGPEQGLGQTTSYYPDPTAVTWQNQAGFGAVPAQGGPRPPMSHSAYRGGGRRGGRSNRGGSRGGVGGGGRGRGRGRGGPHHTATAPGQPPLAQGQWPPPRMAWCELCRVDCNTHEILEQHRNGKRHKKNLQVYEELQKLNKIIVEGAAKEPEPAGGDQQPAETSNPGEAGPAGDRGTKRKMKAGRGGKRPKRAAADGGASAAVPLICELCNVKCDSKAVFDAHLAGKKHVLNMKKFQGDQNLMGQAALALEVLYPALQALLPNVAANVAANVAGGGQSSFSLQVHGPQDYGVPAGSVAATSASVELGKESVDPTVNGSVVAAQPREG